MTLKLYDSVTNQFHLKPESINLNNLNFFHEEEELTGLIETNSINFKSGTVVNSESIDIDLQNIEAVKTKINSAYYFLIIGLPVGLSSFLIFILILSFVLKYKNCYHQAIFKKKDDSDDNNDIIELDQVTTNDETNETGDNPKSDTSQSESVFKIPKKMRSISSDRTVEVKTKKLKSHASSRGYPNSPPEELLYQ